MRTRLNSLIGALFLAQLGAVAAKCRRAEPVTPRANRSWLNRCWPPTEKTGITVVTIFLEGRHA